MDLFVVFVLGGPGSGKGTQSQKLVEEFGFIHLSAGDLLRKEIGDPNSKNGHLISNCIKEGKIVPMEVTVQLLKDAIETNKQNNNLFLIDGFPRKLDQAETFEKTICNSKAVLFYDCEDAILIERLLKRGETSGRTDDNSESINKRLLTYKEETLPVIEYYEKLNKVYKFNAANSIDEIYSLTKTTIQELLNKTNPLNTIGPETPGKIEHNDESDRQPTKTPESNINLKEHNISDKDLSNVNKKSIISEQAIYEENALDENKTKDISNLDNNIIPQQNTTKTDDLPGNNNQKRHSDSNIDGNENNNSMLQETNPKKRKGCCSIL